MRQLWFRYDPEADATWWPDWLSWAYFRALRMRCLGLFHRFEECDTGGPWRGAYGHAWYCVRCLGPYEYDEEFVLSGLWSRLLLRVGGYRLDHWWRSWSWRFER